MNNLRKIFIVCGIAIFTTFTVHSQTRISSPYSRYGIGDLQDNIYLRNISMGGISIGYRNSNCVNYSNPASYTAIDTNSFVFEAGINSQFSHLTTTDLSQTSNYSSLSYLVFGFPITKWWKSSLGLLPYSSVGYKISEFQTMPEVGKINYIYEGSGGLNQFYWGNAFQIKNFSFGFNTSLIFGYLNKTSNVENPDSIHFLNLSLSNSTRVTDFLFNYGIQYQKTFKNGFQFCLGLTYSASAKLAAKQDSFTYTYISTIAGGYPSIKDTIVNSEGKKGKIVLPQSIGAGFTMGKKDKWLVGMDYQVQDWSKFSSFGEKDSLKNSWTTSIGAEFIPNNNAVSGYWKKVRYRVGFRYSQTYLDLRNNQLNDYSVSFGMGLPLRRSKTMINIGFEAGQRGTTSDNLIKDQYARVILSLSLYEFWFIKHRFD